MILTFLFSVLAFGADCKPTPWPFPKNTKISEIIAEAQQMPRELVQRYALGEMVNSRADSLAVPLLKFLHGTESNEKLRGMWGGFGLITYGEELSTLVKKWPRLPDRLQTVSKKEVCRLYKKTLSLP